MKDFLGSIVASIAPDVNAQIEEAKSQAQIIAQAVAAWGFVVVVELGILIYLQTRKRGA